MLYNHKIFVYDSEDLEYYEIKNHYLINKGIAIFMLIVFLFSIFFSFVTICKYLEAKSNEKSIKEVAVELNSELDRVQLDFYYWKENQLKQPKQPNN